MTTKHPYFKNYSENQSVFTAKGRIGRGEFAVFLFIYILLFLAFLFLADFLKSPLPKLDGSPEKDSEFASQVVRQKKIDLFLMLIMSFPTVIIVFLSFKRFHDFGCSEIYIVVPSIFFIVVFYFFLNNFLFVLAIILFAVILFSLINPGTNGPNKYGTIPLNFNELKSFEALVQDFQKAQSKNNLDECILILEMLRMYKSKAKEAMPMLIETLKIRELSPQTMIVLREIGFDAKEAVPILANYLKSEDLELKNYALFALEKMLPQK